MKLSKPKILSLNEKFQEIKYISDVKSMLVDQTKGATMIKITMWFVIESWMTLHVYYKTIVIKGVFFARVHHLSN